ncbi:HD-GYP domain-containing protein [Bacillus sp. DJP31]|uniref:HD-GYP domain-containing protein n=1 Tax=Bacillus sp. DJP31 TaxID=3409789 RepID=UPI003BB6F732
MRLVATESIRPGIKLDKAIFNNKGQVLINKGIPLTDRMIRRLEELGITFVYIDDEHTKDIEIKNSISDKTRKEAIQSIEKAFKDLKVGHSPMANALALEKSTKQFSQIIRSLLIELKGNKELLTLLSDVMIHDHYIFAHSFNVTLYSLAIGMELKLVDKQLEELGLGALLHDVGKMLTPKEILLKPGRLTSEEYEEVKKHAMNGFDLLRNLPNIPLIAAHCAFQHHERLDGSGYPRGVTSKDIHVFGKILAVADVFDAITSNRVYRQAMLPHEGLEILYAGAGQQFETVIVKAFRKAVAIYPIGLTVTLSDRSTGIVIGQNQGYCDRPVIRILEVNNQSVEPYEIDLKDMLDVMITGCSLASKQEKV